MADDLKKSFLAGQAEARQKEKLQKAEAKRQKEDAKRLHESRLDAARKLLDVFNQSGLFRTNKLSYCLDVGAPGEPVCIMIFKVGIILPSANPAHCRIFVRSSSNYALILHKKKETETKFTYDIREVALPGGAENAATEFTRLLGLGEVTFAESWDVVPKDGSRKEYKEACAYRYFMTRVAFLVLLAAVLAWVFFRFS